MIQTVLRSSALAEQPDNSARTLLFDNAGRRNIVAAKYATSRHDRFPINLLKSLVRCILRSSADALSHELPLRKPVTSPLNCIISSNRIKRKGPIQGHPGADAPFRRFVFVAVMVPLFPGNGKMADPKNLSLSKPKWVACAGHRVRADHQGGTVQCRRGFQRGTAQMRSPRTTRAFWKNQRPAPKVPKLATVPKIITSVGGRAFRRIKF